MTRAAPDDVLHVGDPVPLILTKRQLAAHLQISTHQLDEYRRLRSHPAVKELDGPGHVRFSGRALKEWIDGGRTAPATRNCFGRGRGGSR
jgi:hypothetical protein